jgi:alpha-glucosidase (family GH31 glycosyl hydrolase)
MKKRTAWFILLVLMMILVGCKKESTIAPTQTPAVPTTAIPSPPQPTKNPLPTITNTPTKTKILKLEGSHEGAETIALQTECRAFGWVVDPGHPENIPQVRILVDGVEMAQVEANQVLPGLETGENCPGGACAFDVNLWDFLSKDKEHTILIQAMDITRNQWVNINDTPRKLTCSETVAVAPTEDTPIVTFDDTGRAKFEKGGYYLIIEFLDDDLMHIEYGPSTTTTDLSMPIYASPMVAKRDYSGPSQLTTDGSSVLETTDLLVQVSPTTLCLIATDKTRQPDLVLTKLCPRNLGKSYQGISLTPESFTHAYGLGQEFITPGSSEGDWIGRVRSPGPLGNTIGGWNNGYVGNTQFPIVYFTGNEMDNYALFADNVYRQKWDFTRAQWTAELGGDWLRFYLFTGPDLPDLRQDYIELVGYPPVPPKKMFGLWISEYGYDNWAELESKLSSLRAKHFPVDGFVLDLQWFGGIQGNSDNTQMGSLTWNLGSFPDPAVKMVELKETQGVGIIHIEESYIGKGLTEYTDLDRQDFLALDCEGCQPTYLTSNPWWGKGGMIDWTNPAARDYWHDLKRQPLIEAGVIGHWTDLGEPEMYNPNAWYAGILDDYVPLHQQEDIHNLYNLFWSEGIYEGYLRNENQQRPFILSRSGTAGSQRYGVSMWSGDIGSNITSLATQMNVQMHMSMSGMDYFGADIGGFHRSALDGDLNELYTQWFAIGMAFDIPGRTHTENLCNCKETAPDRVGDLQSNLENVRLRYEMSPYLYSLSHRAYLYGEPVIPPLVYYYQSDPEVREMGHEKLLGRDLLVAIVAAYGEVEREVYLPAGDWYNYYTNELIPSPGKYFGPFSTYQDARFKLPMFARAGAIIPQMYVDEKTMNITGLRSDGSLRDELIVRVFSGEAVTNFTLFEDDGETIAYQNGEVCTTLISQESNSQSVIVTVGASLGTYAGAPIDRDNVIKLIAGDGGIITQVRMNGVTLMQFPSQASWEAAPSGWYIDENGMIIARSGILSVTINKTFEFIK